MSEQNEIKDIVKALYNVKVAIESLNPDPTQTIKQHRRRQDWTFGLSIYAAVISTGLLIIEVIF